MEQAPKFSLYDLKLRYTKSKNPNIDEIYILINAFLIQEFDEKVMLQNIHKKHQLDQSVISCQNKFDGCIITIRLYLDENILQQVKEILEQKLKDIYIQNSEKPENKIKEYKGLNKVEENILISQEQSLDFELEIVYLKSQSSQCQILESFKEFLKENNYDNYINYDSLQLEGRPPVEYMGSKCVIKGKFKKQINFNRENIYNFTCHFAYEKEEEFLGVYDQKVLMKCSEQKNIGNASISGIQVGDYSDISNSYFSNVQEDQKNYEDLEKPQLIEIIRNLERELKELKRNANKTN